MESKSYAFIVIALVLGLIGGYFAGSMPLQEQINSIQLQLTDQEQQISELQSSIGLLETIIEEQNITIHGLQTTISEKNGEIYELNSAVYERNDHIGFLQGVIAELESIHIQKDAIIGSLEDMIAELQNEINNLNMILLTEFQIEDIEWNVNENQLIVTVRNTGQYLTLIEFISVRKNVEGSLFETQEVAPPIELQVENVTVINWGGVDADLKLEQGSSYVVRVTCSTGFYYDLPFSIPAPQEPPKYTQIKIVNLVWDINSDTATISVKNTGTQTANIVSISAYTDSSGWIIDNSTNATGTINIGQTAQFVLDLGNLGWDIQSGDEYLVRVTCSTGYYTEKYSTVADPTETNLVKNGGFETGDLSNWVTSGNTVKVVSSGAYEGSYCLEIGGNAEIKQTLSQTSIKKITFWAKCSNPSESSYIVIFFKGAGSFSTTIGPISNSWQKFEATSTISYNELVFSTTDEDYPDPELGYIYPETKLIDNITITP
ncbi:carbohydrate binding domain-containing protein [Candidatus Bathyarchaeota archaeon]|nr:carbohydrate binding domain-containing protein [Candidatus Bathyarchaeota archaeon]